LQKIRSNGGELRYVDMDEPFFFGHSDPSGCHLSATQLGQHVSLRCGASFPNSKSEIASPSMPITNGSRNWPSGRTPTGLQQASRSPSSTPTLTGPCNPQPWTVGGAAQRAPYPVRHLLHRFAAGSLRLMRCGKKQLRGEALGAIEGALINHYPRPPPASPCRAGSFLTFSSVQSVPPDWASILSSGCWFAGRQP
jgi:hypothetical protein